LDHCQEEEQQKKNITRPVLHMCLNMQKQTERLYFTGTEGNKLSKTVTKLVISIQMDQTRIKI